MMRKSTNIAILLFCLFTALYIARSCEPEDIELGDTNCDYCLSYKPDSADLWVFVTINTENPEVPVSFYRGNVEDGVLDWVDTARNDTLFLYSKMGEYYSVKASYKKNGNPIIAIDGDKLRIENGSEDCYSPCYLIKGGTLNVRLK